MFIHQLREALNRTQSISCTACDLEHPFYPCRVDKVSKSLRSRAEQSGHAQTVGLAKPKIASHCWPKKRVRLSLPSANFSSGGPGLWGFQRPPRFRFGLGVEEVSKTGNSAKPVSPAEPAEVYERLPREEILERNCSNFAKPPARSTKAGSSKPKPNSAPIKAPIPEPIKAIAKPKIRKITPTSAKPLRARVCSG